MTKEQLQHGIFLNAELERMRKERESFCNELAKFLSCRIFTGQNRKEILEFALQKWDGETAPAIKEISEQFERL